MLLIWLENIEVLEMKKIVELPIIEPIYQTYQYQGSGAATIKNNPTIRNWYLNEAVNLTCSRRFLTQTALLDVTIVYSEYQHNPYLEKKFYSMQFLNGYINPLIRNLLNDGYYVYFTGVDDFYVQGKSLYQKHHMLHDGLICGYNQNDKTYCIYSYDINWVYRKFWTSQKSFNEGRIAMQKQGKYGIICAIKPKPDIVNFSIKRAYEKIKEYLNSSLEVYPLEEDKNPYGIAVQLYIVKYLDRLIEGSIPYKNMDRRVFRLIWEHKKAMLERIEAIEEYKHNLER